MKTSIVACLFLAFGMMPALAEPPDEGGEPADHEKQPSTPGVVIVVLSQGVTLLTNATSSDYPPPVVIVDGDVVNRF